MLQKENLTMSEARTVFDVIVDNFQLDATHSSYLFNNCSLLHDFNFENAIVDIQNHKGHELNRQQLQSTMKLLKKVPKAVITQNSSRSTFDEGYYQKRQKLSSQEPTTSDSYINTTFIPPTSNICERLFSKAKIIYGTQRHRIEIESFECQLYLHVNRDYWNITTLTGIIPAQSLQINVSASDVLS